MKTLHPCDGGCWFCHTDSDVDEEGMAFSCEFDTYFHMKCLKKALVDDPQHPEALIIEREFK